MNYQIWRHLIQILPFRNDLIDFIKPFFEQLTNNKNNEKYNINEEKHIHFLKSLSNFKLNILHKYEIIDKKLYIAAVHMENIISSRSCNNKEKIVEEIIERDKIEDLQKLIREKDIRTISPILHSFNEVEKLNIPIIIMCIMKKAIKCFKFLLINGIEDPTITMHEDKPEIAYISWNGRRYEWDCMSIAIYYGEVEIIKILEEEGYEKGNKSAHIEAAILSYRNTIAKEILIQMKEKKDNQRINDDFFNLGLRASVKNNNIKGAEILFNIGANLIEKKNQREFQWNQKLIRDAINNNSKEILELLISKGAYINTKDIIYHIIESNSKEIGEVLIRKGTNINTKDIIYQILKIIFSIKRIKNR